MVCRNCFTQISDSNIVADVTFQEDSRGAATVQGGFIGENARHARSLGGAAIRRVGGSEKNTQQEIESNGRRALAKLCPRLGISESISNQAASLYLLASGHNFSAGRRTDEVVAACLYAALRRKSDNTVLLIDIAELLRLSVFRLGEVYKAMCAELFIVDKNGVGTQHLVEVESLITKYCGRLEFGNSTTQVAADAIKIIRRMKRDWIVTGRHPAGLCGACIILSARMNNFRRSVREVVYVAKVCDQTIAKRVEEFRRTKAAALTVQQFKDQGLRIIHQHDPPSWSAAQERTEKLEKERRRRLEASVARETPVIEISDDASDASSRDTSVATSTPAQEGEEAPRKRRKTGATQSATPAPIQQALRRDADGFLIPALPVDPAITGQQQASPAPEKRKRGRSKREPPPPIELSEEELGVESQLQAEIEYELNDEGVVDSRDELQKAKDEERARLLAQEQKKGAAEKTKSRREAAGITWWDDKLPTDREEVTAEDLEAEFADDPEVLNCRLSPEEQMMKERIWVAYNEDWLRQQQEKKLLESVAKGRNEQGKKKGEKIKRKKKGKMGDGTTLAEATTPVETPVDANEAMLARRAPPHFSRYINWGNLKKVYQPSPSSTSKTTSQEGSQTPSGSGDASRDQTPSTAGRTAEQEGESVSPTPAPRPDRLQSPPQTQQMAAAAAASPIAPRRVRIESPQPPASPLPTQAQATQGALNEESEGDEDDYVQEEVEDYGSDEGTPAWGEGDDDREDIGEDDYQRAINPTGGAALEETFGDEYY